MSTSTSTSSSTSLLLTKLPREIRSLIWIFCIGNQDIHLDLALAPNKRSVLTQPLSKIDPLALLLVCKQISIEAQPVLYTTSTFHFTSLTATATLTQLTHTLPLSTLCLIRSLHLTYTLPTLPVAEPHIGMTGYTPLCESSNWLAMWGILCPANEDEDDEYDVGKDERENESDGRGKSKGKGRMGRLGGLQGLRDVKLIIKVPILTGQKEAWRAREKEILRDVRTMKSFKGRFVLVLPWEKRDCPGTESGDNGGLGKDKVDLSKEVREEMCKGWKIERFVGDAEKGKTVFAVFGAWDMQRELERVWGSRYPIGL
ncbi:hypothetical protein ONS95_003429 [Cadophora gregata]|uniref:uncharacterized protein n=1 Tax=Cadophora gregata TaxID=51156 RepID=UPI0026DC9C25|nr:uncharacterized protein ONS95_003429 [Cadophora gregata]KAK0108636.1 hypothetical protein ONS95_003429 [Cadophora gregata]KAK0108773.1 hypothetical protein ONS96_002618 [Cadophora gregata f. sp. sojae]